MDRERMVISRYWKNPEITVKITAADIGLSMSAMDFLESVAAEMGNPALLMTSTQLRNKLLTAAKSVIEKTKEASIGVI